MANKIIEVKIEQMDYPNISYGTYKDDMVRFKGGILGQTCRIKLTKNKPNNKRGKYLNLIKNSYIENAKDFCPNADICGACVYQKVPYETELMLKQDMIRRLLEDKEIKLKDPVRIHRSPKIKSYRNKMLYTFGDQVKGGPLVLGLHKKARIFEIVDTKGCNVVDKDFENIRNFVQEYFRQRNASFYHSRQRTGLLRYLLVRKAMNTEEIMVALVTTSDDGFDDIKKDLFAQALLQIETRGNIKSIYHIKSDSLSDDLVAENMDLLFGRSYIEEELMGLKFRISPLSFFQPNVYTASKLYQKAFEFAEVDEESKVLDLYSGTGTITQLMASKCKKAIGIEIVEEAVEKAKENASLNDINNIEFICGDVLEEIDKIEKDFDTIILDPPRAGINPKAIEKIIAIKPEQFVYISCNPRSQLRDFKIFGKYGYKVKKYEIFDQFVNSSHVETIALLSKD